MATTRRKRGARKKATAKSSELREGYISENFTIREVGKSSTAVREGIDNTPTEEVIQRATVLADNVLEKVREHFGIPYSPGSWFRCEILEKLITRNGFGRWCANRNIPKDADAWAEYFPRKSHPKGEAADIEVPGVSNQDLFDWIKENCEFDQLIMEGGPDGWIHVSCKKTGNRNEAFEILNP